MTEPGQPSWDPFVYAGTERIHVLYIIQKELGYVYYKLHYSVTDKTEDATQFWRELLEMRETFTESLRAKKMTYHRFEGPQRDESESYVSPNPDVVCYKCGKNGRCSSTCPLKELPKGLL